ncbi:small acid-soluble spore protein Tlp [Rossellomorea vietnamensis]|uniref:Small, acid-soluble spore protein Tlp n=1 Tax=Rossellomorea vietnamensis TaxID=218284 RepID=A0A5D4MEC2_9BACI|nr:small acid-soluble spore protein Tlp [Rossellomorea vietnamensis]TYR99375.1 small acid-soluble spore protein Tlp [Rossellomorea vietnamensis]
MAEQQNRPNPDDRSDNVEKLQSKVFHTIQNMERAEESMAYTDSEEQLQSIQSKNERRRESIDAFRSELKDEAAFQKNGQSNQYN